MKMKKITHSAFVAQRNAAHDYTTARRYYAAQRDVRLLRFAYASLNLNYK